MASQNGDILLTIKSLFKGEGFTKADQAIKSTSKSAKTATESIQKVTSALGTMDNTVGKVAGKLGTLFSSFAQGGIIGLAISGVTAAFSLVAEKISEIKKRSEEAAEAAKKVFEQKLSNIRVKLNADIEKSNKDAASNKALNDAYAKYDNDHIKRQIQTIQQEGALRRAKMTDNNESSLDQLKEELEIQRLRSENVVQNAKKESNDAQINLTRLREQYKMTAQADGTEMEMLRQKEKTLEEEVAKAEAELNRYERFRISTFSGEYPIATLDNEDVYAYQDKVNKARQSLNDVRISNSDRLIQMFEESTRMEKEIMAAEVLAKNAQQNFVNVKNLSDGAVETAEAKYNTALTKSTEDAKQKNQDFRLFLHAQKQKLEEDVAKRLDDANAEVSQNEKASERQRLEDEKDKKTKETVEQIDKLNKSIKKWEKAANDKARLYDQLGLNEGQGGFGADFKDVILGEGEDVRGRQNKLDRDRRNLLGKMDRARAAGGRAWDNWQKNWERLNGNPEKKLEDAQKTRDMLQKQLANDVKDISQKIKELGL